MGLPDPAPGLIVRYSYLWRNEAVDGSREGRKDRPCVIVVAFTDTGGDIVVTVAPITHTLPAGDETAVALPASVKKRLSLDDAPSWVITRELNRFVWPGYDLRPIARNRPGVFAFGYLSTDVFAQVTRNIVANAKAGRMGLTPR